MKGNISLIKQQGNGAVIRQLNFISNYYFFLR